tara:strand:- start:852 stop:1415 length:564 start_codon:yes stop_codon:yes gene_type:complete
VLPLLFSCGGSLNGNSESDDVVIDDLETVEEYIAAQMKLYNVLSEYKIEKTKIFEDSKSIEERTSRIDKLEKNTNPELIRKKINKVKKKMNRTFMPGEIEDADNFDDMENAYNRWQTIKESEPSKFMEDLAAKCIEDMYDCDCYSNKIIDYFKNDKNYAQWSAKSDALPGELIISLMDCSNQDEFDF